MIVGACTSMKDAWEVSISHSMDVSNVGRTRKSMCYDALLGGLMVFVIPLSNVNHSQMLTLNKNLENGRFFMGH
jgi:hypothetical protein